MQLKINYSIIALTLLGVGSTLWNCSSASATPTTPTTMTIDTSGISGQSGYYEFAFAENPVGGPGATVTTYLTNVIVGSAPTVASLGSLDNTSIPFGYSGPSDTGLLAASNFGNTFSFDYSFSPSTLDPSDPGDDLELYFYDSGENSISTNDPSGSDLVADINIGPGASQGGPVAITPYQYALSVQSTPETSAVEALVVGLLALFACATVTRIGRRKPTTFAPSKQQ